MFYPEMSYLPEAEDPSVTLETDRLVAKVIDNNGLRRPDAKPYFSGAMVFGAFTHHFGYHGIRTLYDKSERRNVAAPFLSILNWQGVGMDGVELDPVDDRAAFGIPRGWPLKLRQDGDRVMLRLFPLASAQFAYTLTISPASDGSPDALDFSVRFLFGKKSAVGRFSASWACYLAGYDSAAMYYPATADTGTVWKEIGRQPDMVIGEAVGYRHDQTAYRPDDIALPLAYVRIGARAFVLMFSDPAVRPFVVNAGGHLFMSAVQNPAFDFEWRVEDYPLDRSVGFDGRLIYTPFASDEDLLRRYGEFTSAR